MGLIELQQKECVVLKAGKREEKGRKREREKGKEDAQVLAEYSSVKV
jgi:hypothetical protein